MNITDYYCTTRYRSDIVHITKEEDGFILCNDYQTELTYYKLHKIHIYTNEEPITLYSNLCTECLKKLPNNVREKLIYNFVLAKLKS